MDRLDPPVGDEIRRIVQTMAERCDTCIFRPGNLMHLQEGRVQSMVRAAQAGEGHITCHKTLTWKLAAICRGYIEADKHRRSLALRVIAAGLAKEVKVDGNDLYVGDAGASDAQDGGRTD